MAIPMVISTGAPTCAQDDGGTQANALVVEVLCLSYFPGLISVTLFGRFSFLQVYGVVEVLIYEVSVRILITSSDSQSVVCPFKLNCVQTM